MMCNIMIAVFCRRGSPRHKSQIFLDMLSMDHSYKTIDIFPYWGRGNGSLPCLNLLNCTIASIVMPSHLRSTPSAYFQPPFAAFSVPIPIKLDFLLGLAPISQYRENASCSIVDGMIYIFGGYYDTTFLSQCEVYDIANNKWDEIASLPFARYQTGAAALNRYFPNIILI